MRPQAPKFPMCKLLLTSGVLLGGTAVHAQEVFTVTGPVGWAGTQDTVTWDSTEYFDGTFEARITHDPATPLASSYSFYEPFTAHNAEWNDAIASIEYTVYDPEGNVRFSATVLPDPTPGVEDDSFSYYQNMNRVRKDAKDLRNHEYDYPQPFSTQQYWDISYADGSGFLNYAQAAYIRNWSGSTAVLDDFVSRLTEYPQAAEPIEWTETQFTGYTDADNFMKVVIGPITMTDVTVDADGDGVLDNADACPASNLAAQVVIGAINTRVGNTLLDSGCTLSDLISLGIEIDANHGSNTSSVARILNGLVMEGYISGKNRGAIQSAMARSKRK